MLGPPKTRDLDRPVLISVGASGHLRWLNHRKGSDRPMEAGQIRTFVLQCFVRCWVT